MSTYNNPPGGGNNPNLILDPNTGKHTTQEAINNIKTLKILMDELNQSGEQWNDEWDSSIEKMGLIKSLIAEKQKESQEFNNSIGGIVNSWKKLLAETEGVNKSISRAKSITGSIVDIGTKLLIQGKIEGDLSSSQVRSLIDKQKIKSHMLDEEIKAMEHLRNLDDTSNDDKDKLTKSIAHAMEMKDQIRGIDEANKEVLKSALNIEKGYGLSGATLDGIGNILGKIGGNKLKNALGLEEAQVAMKNKSKEVTTFGEKSANLLGQMKVFAAGISSVFKSLISAAPQMLLIFAITKVISTIVDLFKGMDEASGKFAKDMNISYSEATNINSEMASLSKRSGMIGVTTERLINTLGTVNSMYGVQGQLTEDQLKNATQLQITAGLSLENQKGALDLSIANKQELSKVTGEIMAQAHISSSKLGVAINEKDVLKEIGKTSAATTLSLGKNPKLIADAVAVTKSLGMEMSKIESIMDNMLNFEDSISNELQAELLIGRNINLETARWASLNNDVAGTAKAIADEIGTSADFTNMNRIQQESLAKAVGMNREELAKTLFVQEQIRNLSGQQAKEKEKAFNKLVETYGIEKAQEALAQGKLESLQNQMSASEQLGEMFNRLKEILAPMVAKMMPFIAALMEKIAEWAANGGGLWGLMKVNVDKNDIAKHANFGSEFRNSPVPTNSEYKTGIQQYTQDGISPSSNGPFTITDRFGATAVTAQGDHMVVSPNVSTSNQQRQQVIQQPVQQIQNNDTKETNRLLQALLQKQGNVQIDSTKMGTAIGMNTYNIQ